MPNYHKWELSGAWGVISGVSRCTVCHVWATKERMNKPLCPEETKPGEESRYD